MNVTLSRRVGRLSNTPQVIQLTPEEREVFVKRVEEAAHFGKLPKVWQEFIERAERSLQEGVVLRYGKKAKIE